MEDSIINESFFQNSQQILPYVFLKILVVNLNYVYLQANVVMHDNDPYSSFEKPATGTARRIYFCFKL